MLPKLILASQSPARRQLLTDAGLSFTVEPSYFDESQVQECDPATLVTQLALKKAERVAAHHPEPALIVGADSVLYLQGEIHGKPRDAQEARHRWHQMRGQVGELYTGHALVDTAQRRSLSHYGLTRVFFARPSDHEIQDYIESGEPLSCAGCFAIDGLGGMFVDRIEGCHGNVIGLSMPLLRRMLAELGYTMTAFWKDKQA